MLAIPAVISMLLALSAAAAIPQPEAQPEANLEERQSFSAIRLWDTKDFQGAWADMSINNPGECENLPTSLKDRVSSFKLSIYACRFFEHDNCQGKSTWFRTDNSNLRAGSTGYRGDQNDEFSSAICTIK